MKAAVQSQLIDATNSHFRSYTPTQHVDRFQFERGEAASLPNDQRLVLNEVLEWASITICSSDGSALRLWGWELVGEGRFRSHAQLVLPDENYPWLASARRIDAVEYLSVGDIGVADSFSCVAFDQRERLGTLRIPHIVAITVRRAVAQRN